MKNIFKKIASAALMLTFLSPAAGTAFASSSTAGETQKKFDNVEISFMIPEWGVPTEAMLKDFNDKTGIKVNVQPTSWDDIRNKISTAAAGKKVAADIYEVDWSWVGEFKSAGWLMPLDVTEEEINDIPTLSTFKVGDEYLAMPYANDFRIAYYNTEDYGKINAAEAPKTWNEVIEDSKKIKADKIKEYPISLPMNADENATTTFLWLTYTRNGIVFNDDNTLNREAALDSLKLIDELNKEGLINPANRSSSGMDAYRQISSGDTSFMVGPSSFVSRINDEKESKVVGKVQPIMIPGKDKVSDSSVPFAEAIGISPFTENPEACREFVKWYSSKETQMQLFDALNISPTRSSVLQEIIDSGKIKDSGAMLELAKIIKSPFPNGVPDYYTEMSTEMFNIINSLANGKITPEAAADQMTEKVNALVEENR